MTQKVIDALNHARSLELTAISQYMSQHYELENQGYGKLASKVKEIGIVEMKHAEALAERIMFLDGVPIYKPADVVKTGEEIAAMIRTDIGLEAGGIKAYNDAVAVCAAEKDQVSVQLFEELLGNEEDHIDVFQKTLEHIEKLGAAYLTTLMD